MSLQEKLRELIEDSEQPDVQQPEDADDLSSKTMRPGSPRPGPLWSRLLAAAVAVLALVALVFVVAMIEIAVRGRTIFRALRVMAGADDGGEGLG